MDQQADFRTAQNNALNALGGHFINNFQVLFPRLIFDFSYAEFMENNGVYSLDVIRIGNHNADSVLCQLSLVEVLLHRILGSKQANSGNVLALQYIGSRLCDMYERNVHITLHLLENLVHGIRTDQNKVCACGLQILGGFAKNFTTLFPRTRRLAPFYFIKIYAV